MNGPFSVHWAAWGELFIADRNSTFWKCRLHPINPKFRFGIKIVSFKSVNAEKLMYSSYFGILFILSFSGRNHAACKTRMSTRTTAPIMKIMTRSYYYFYFMPVKVHIAGIPISELQDLP